jgi:hypothetical protein
VDPATLDGGAGHDRDDGLTQAEVGVGDDQLHPGQASGLERPQERGPEGAVFGVSNGEAEDFAAAVAAHAGGNHDGLGDDPAVDPGLAVGGVHEHIREGLSCQGAVTEGCHLAVEVGTDPAHLALADAAVGTKGADQVVDLAGADSVEVGLHHHREQGLINPAAPLQQAGKERPGPQLGIRSSRSPAVVASSLGRCPLRWVSRSACAGWVRHRSRW